MNNYYPLVTVSRAHQTCKFSVKVFSSEKIVHILDLYEKGTTSVTNGAYWLFERVFDSFLKSGVPEDWTWVLYDRDGIISLYDVIHDNFTFARGVATYAPFASFMEERKEPSGIIQVSQSSLPKLAKGLSLCTFNSTTTGKPHVGIQLDMADGNIALIDLDGVVYSSDTEYYNLSGASDVLESYLTLYLTDDGLLLQLHKDCIKKSVSFN